MPDAGPVPASSGHESVRLEKRIGKTGLVLVFPKRSNSVRDAMVDIKGGRITGKAAVAAVTRQ